MSNDDTIEVPVTRRARTTRVGKLVMGSGYLFIQWIGIDSERLAPGDEVACRGPGGWWRNGTARVAPGGDVDFRRIVAACDGDDVYRVEPP